MSKIFIVAPVIYFNGDYQNNCSDPEGHQMFR